MEGPAVTFDQVRALSGGLLCQHDLAIRARVSQPTMCRRIRRLGMVPAAVRWRLRLYTPEQAAALGALPPPTPQGDER